MSAIENYNSIMTFMMSIISLIIIIIGVIQWKMRTILKSNSFRLDTSHNLSGLMARIDELCKKLNNMEKRIEGEIIQSREEHARMQTEHYELVKELYKLIGEVRAMKK